MDNENRGLRYLDRRAFIGGAALLAAGATAALVQPAQAVNPPDDKVARRLDKVADNLAKVTAEMTSISDVFAVPPDPDEPAVAEMRTALLRIMTECAAIDRIADDMLARLDAPR
jgi:hypothetical protein